MEVNRGRKRDKEPFSGLINIIYQSFILIMPVLSKRGDISHKTQYIYMHIYNHPLYSKKKRKKEKLRRKQQFFLFKFHFVYLIL